IPNDGDDITKAAVAAALDGFYDPDTEEDPYTGEGVYWYDLEQGRSGGTGPFERLPPAIHALGFDPLGRLLVGTEGGLWRGVAYGFGYDKTSGGTGIVFGGSKSSSPPGMKLTSLNGNLQIASLTSLAIDPNDTNVIYTTQIGTGAAGSDG